MPAAHFAFDGQHVFLTYPQSGELSRERVRDFFLDLDPLCDYVVGREAHRDRGNHIHAYIRWNTRRRFVGANCFDVDGRHPNIQSARAPKRVIAYVRKEDTEPLVSNGISMRDGAVASWDDVLGMSNTREQFLELARKLFPRDFVLRLRELFYFCEWRFGPEETRLVEPRLRSDFVEPAGLVTWVATYLAQVKHPAHAYIG